MSARLRGDGDRHRPAENFRHFGDARDLRSMSRVENTANLCFVKRRPARDLALRKPGRPVSLDHKGLRRSERPRHQDSVSFLSVARVRLGQGKIGMNAAELERGVEASLGLLESVLAVRSRRDHFLHSRQYRKNFSASASRGLEQHSICQNAHLALLEISQNRSACLQFVGIYPELSAALPNMKRRKLARLDGGQPTIQPDHHVTSLAPRWFDQKGRRPLSSETLEFSNKGVAFHSAQRRSTTYPSDKNVRIASLRGQMRSIRLRSE